MSISYHLLQPYTTALLLDLHPWQITSAHTPLRKKKQLEENFHRLPPNSSGCSSTSICSPIFCLVIFLVCEPPIFCLKSILPPVYSVLFLLTYSKNHTPAMFPFLVRSSFSSKNYISKQTPFKNILDLASLISCCPISLLPMQQTCWKSHCISLLLSLLPVSLLTATIGLFLPLFHQSCSHPCQQ